MAAGVSAAPAAVLSSLPLGERFQTFTATLTQVQCRSFVSITGLIPIQCLMVSFFQRPYTYFSFSWKV